MATKELVFSGSDYRVICFWDNYRFANVQCFPTQLEAREYLESIEATEIFAK
jgi:hypothetical protein